ncbi:MAG: MBL fold metallo-hydrolase [Bacteroidales bacterium]|jgi:glyoxylase-like metal-dependent hydrolase (beta-lactamase superfamily II)
MNVAVRINGTAPAWPVFLESKQPFYFPATCESLGSVSYSILADRRGKGESRLWEVLIDAGHNTVPYLIRNGNRIPEAILLTHAHNDHVLGVDWIVQSFRYKHNKSKKYPVYSTRAVMQEFLRLFPYLEEAVEHTELLPGRKTPVKETESLEVTAYPVFHGSATPGASMFCFEGNGFHPVIITGDMLCPLLRKRDYHSIGRAAAMFTDTNNRFPDPYSGHASFVSHLPGTKDPPEKLKQWFKTTKIEQLIQPHLDGDQDKATREYFDEFASDWQEINELPHTILGLNDYLNIPEVYLVHYFGYYDKTNYNKELLDRNSLEKWANQVAKEKHMKNVVYKVPRTGDLIRL